jgi:hypothetical protein
MKLDKRPNLPTAVQKSCFSLHAFLLTRCFRLDHPVIFVPFNPVFS